MIARRQKTFSSSWMQCLVYRVLLLWGPEFESLPQVFQYYISVTFKCQCQCNPTASTDGTSEIPLVYNILHSHSKKALVTVITGQTAHGDLCGLQHCCCEHRIDVNEDTCWHSEGSWRQTVGWSAFVKHDGERKSNAMAFFLCLQSSSVAPLPRGQC